MKEEIIFFSIFLADPTSSSEGFEGTLGEHEDTGFINGGVDRLRIGKLLCHQCHHAENIDLAS